MEVGGFGAESTLVHSPGAHYHSQATNNSQNMSSSSSSSGDSEVSDMVVENSSRFEALSKQRKKSGGSDYRPQSASNSMSESESESVSNSGSYSEQSTPLSQKKVSSGVRLSDEDSGATSSRSVSMTPVPRNRLKNSPVVRKSPLNVSHRSAPSEVTAMRGYRYSMLPSRSAATNVSYSRYLEEEESDSDYAGFGNRKRGRKQASSDSEFEVGGRGEESASEELSISEEDFSEDEYRPPKRKARGGRQKVCAVEGRGMEEKGKDGRREGGIGGGGRERWRKGTGGIGGRETGGRRRRGRKEEGRGNRRREREEEEE